MKILSIAGSDPSGGAGIQADIVTITHLKGIAMTAITAITAQDESEVYDVEHVSSSIIIKQVEATINCADAVKTGMLGNIKVVEAVSSILPTEIPIIVDPVIFSTSGYRLLSQDATQLMKKLLIPQARLVTPNILEAELLSNHKITNTQDMVEAGREILKLGAKAVLVKGGHLIQDNKISDVLVQEGKEHFFVHDVVNAENTHGTGCRLSAAIACNIASNQTLEKSIENAIQYVSNYLLTKETA